MTGPSPAIKVIEISGDRFESLEAAQDSARVTVAFGLAQIIKDMIEQGTLEIKNGQVVPKEKDERKIDDE